MYKLKLEHHFSSAHQLIHAYDNKCNDSIHGHNWRVIVTIETSQLVNEMVVDFTKIKEIINHLDHKNLNEILPFETTAENLARHIQELIFEEVKVGREIAPLVSVELYEADKASITYS